MYTIILGVVEKVEDGAKVSYLSQTHQHCHCPAIPPKMSSPKKWEDIWDSLGGHFRFFICCPKLLIFVKLKLFVCRLSIIIYLKEKNYIRIFSFFKYLYLLYIYIYIYYN